MRFDAFKQTVAAAGLVAKDCGNSHWQIRGGKYCVNFYPFAKHGPTFYVNATNSGTKRATVQDAIVAASNPMHKRRMVKTRRKRSYKGTKNRLLRSDPHCYWCRKPLDKATATNDHIIPLSKCGTNGLDNQVLACLECNRHRRAQLPNRTEWQKLS